MILNRNVLDNNASFWCLPLNKNNQQEVQDDEEAMRFIDRDSLRRFSLCTSLWRAGCKREAATDTHLDDDRTTVVMTKEQPYGLYKEVTGYDIKCESLAGTEQLILLIAFGEKKGAITVTSDQLTTVISEGAAMDTKALIERYGPDIKKAIPTLFATTTADGKVYAIPSVKAALGFCGWNILAREDLIFKARLKHASNIDEFYKKPRCAEKGLSRYDLFVLKYLIHTDIKCIEVCKMVEIKIF